MVPHCEEEYIMSYVREEHAILSFTHRTEQERKKKRLSYIKNKSSELHTCVLSKGKRERETETKLHSFIDRRKNLDAQEEKKSLVFFAEFLGSFFSCFLACSLYSCFFIAVIDGVLFFSVLLN
jgi:hypothetical protein